MDRQDNFSSGADKVESLASGNRAEDAHEQLQGKIIEDGSTKTEAERLADSEYDRPDAAVTYGGRVSEEQQIRNDIRQAEQPEYKQQVQTMHDRAAERRALKKERREYQREERKHKKEHRKGGDKTPGFGGWLAAVITLGVTSLALATVVTYGWITMDDMRMQMAGVSRQSLYELNSIIDNLDADLSRVRATTSTGDRVRTLTEIAIGSETAETVLERMPVQLQSTEQLASFLNKMGDSAKAMIYVLARGGELSPSQISTLQFMYEVNKSVKENINELTTNADDMDVLDALRGKDNLLGSSFDKLQNNSFETPKSIQDGPFADRVMSTNPKALEDAKEITPQEAEELARKYFSAYNLTEVRCTGEAAGKAVTTYNLSLMTADGEMMAQISKQGGKVIMFDSFKDCNQHNFDVERCIAIAEDFLPTMGYDGLVPVWASENGTTCNINFAPVKDGAILYPDLVKVKVCEERGIVTGIDGMSYVLNHGERQTMTPAIEVTRARQSLNGNMTVEGERLALIPLDGEEVLCYEFYGKLDDNEYYVYVDAATGEEMEVLTVIGTAQGRALM